MIQGPPLTTEIKQMYTLQFPILDEVLINYSPYANQVRVYRFAENDDDTIRLKKNLE